MTSVFTVTNTGDAGPGTLRQAITDLNNSVSAAADTIDFALSALTDPGYNASTGSFTIIPASTLPTITHPVVIDGYTQAGASPNTLAVGDNAVLKVELFQTPEVGYTGLVISSGNSTVRGLVIDGSANIVLVSGGGNLIQGNFIGTDVSGTVSTGTAFYGVYARSGSGGNTIGSHGDGVNDFAARNIISESNRAVFTYITGAGVDLETGNNVVAGNYLGTDVTGTHPLGTDATGANGLPGAAAANGVAMVDTSNNRIGSLGAANIADRNVISGNLGNGVFILDGGASQADENDVVAGNYIGTDATGTARLTNIGTGVHLGGGIGEKVVNNLISGNSYYGVFLDSARNCVISGNDIGTDVTGTQPLGNGFSGISAQEIGGGNNLIGGTSAAQRNVISANGQYGISAVGIVAFSGSKPFEVIEGNYIGTDATGTAAMGNRYAGILLEAVDITIGAPGAGNLISGNGDPYYGTDSGGIILNTAARITIQANLIGTDATGTKTLGNGFSGITIVSAPNGGQNLIGGLDAGDGNTIVGATPYIPRNTGGYGIGVVVTGTTTVGDTTNSIEGNSIYGNARLGIDLGDDGVTPNTPGGPHVGANELQNYPVLASALAGATSTVTGTFNSTPGSTFRLEFFASPVADPSGHGQGQRFLGFANVTTNATGDATFSAPGLAASAFGETISATATAADGNTSEFSADIPAAPALIGKGVAVSATEGAVFTGAVATFTDSETGDHSAGMTAVISWGDGHTSPGAVSYSGGTYTVTSTNTYDEEGSYAVGVTVTDPTGNTFTVGAGAVTSGAASSWNADGNTNDSLNANNGTFVGAAHYVTGEAGNAFHFDGTNYVQIPNSSSLEPAQLTADGWIKPVFAGRPSQVADGDFILTKYNVTGGYGLGLAMDPTFPFAQVPAGGVPLGTPVFWANISGHFNQIFGSTPVPNDGQFHHVAATYDGATMSLYLDGVLDASRSVSGAIVNSSADAFIGREISTPRNSHADVDEVHLFGRALTAAEIGSIANGGRGSTATVADAALTAGALTPPTAVEGQAIAGATVFHFTDADPMGTAGDYTAVVTLGDGNTVTLTGTPTASGRIVANAGGFDVQLTYTYAEELTNQTFGVVVTDVGGASTGASTAAFGVADPAVVAAGVSTITATYGSPVGGASTSLAAFTDPGGAEPTAVGGHYSAVINWGDLSPEEAGTVTFGGAPGSSTDSFQVTGPAHAYHAGSYTITVAINHGGILSSATTKVVINKALLTVTAGDQAKVYGSADPALTYTPSGTLYYNDSYAVIGGVSLSTDTGSAATAGTHTILVTGGTAGDYVVATVNGTLSVARAPLSVTAADATKVYGAALPALTGSLTGVVGGDPISVSYSTPATAGSDVLVGGYPVTPALSDPNGRLSNYTVTTMPGTLTVTRAAQSISWAVPADIVYGTALGGGQLDATVNVGGPAAGGALTYNFPVGTILHAGSGQALTVSAAATIDYDPATTTVSINVTPAPLTITAVDKSRVFGASNPSFTATYIGFVLGQDPSALNGATSFATPATVTSPVGSYPIIVSGPNSTDYSITFVNATLRVTPDATVVGVSTSAGPSVVGQAVTFTATVSAAAPGSGTPTGTVTFLDGATTLGTAVLSGGVATFTTSGLAVGSHSITAVFGGGSNFTTGTSPALTQTVNPATGSPVSHGQTATIGFWSNKNGQALINGLNGGPDSKALGNWLAGNFANLYGSAAGPDNLAGKTNSQVAAFFMTLFDAGGQKLDAQVLGTALAVYVTTSSLSGTVASQYGFVVTSAGTGASTYNVGSSGVAFGVADNTALTVLQVLRAANQRAVRGVLYNGDTNLDNLANPIFDGINQSGDIT